MGGRDAAKWGGQGQLFFVSPGIFPYRLPIGVDEMTFRSGNLSLACGPWNLRCRPEVRQRRLQCDEKERLFGAQRT